jgi:hypothetical protein
MPDTNVFALKATGLEPFLFAEVGIERSGASLTMLSLLARLGEDPWAEAARWAKLPKAALLNAIGTALAANPTTGFSESEASEAAARLARLLPTQAAAPAATHPLGAGLNARSTMAPWLKFAALSSALALGIAINLARAPADPAEPASSAAATAIAQAQRPTVPHSDAGAGPAAHPAPTAAVEPHVSL